MSDARTRSDPALAALGPDVLGESFDTELFLRRLRAEDPTRPIGDALLNQRTVAGIGNLWKAETCFAVGVDPVAAGRRGCATRRRSRWSLRARAMRESPAPATSRARARSTAVRGGRVRAAARTIRQRGQWEDNRLDLLVPALSALSRRPLRRNRRAASLRPAAPARARPRASRIGCRSSTRASKAVERVLRGDRVGGNARLAGSRGDLEERAAGQRALVQALAVATITRARAAHARVEVQPVEQRAARSAPRRSSRAARTGRARQAALPEPRARSPPPPPRRRARSRAARH